MSLHKQPVQGCRDFPPEEFRTREWLFAKFRQVARIHSFEEYDAPMLEPEQLYVTKAAGEEILDQMYTLTTKGGDKLALRPEMTPSLARLVIQKGQSLLLPIKWFSLPQCWRYEAIVRGRRREHYQWNMDIWGVESVTAEAELLSALISLFCSLGLTWDQVGIKISSRKLLQAFLEEIGLAPDQFISICLIIDKGDKLNRSQIESLLSEQGLVKASQERIFRFLEIKNLDEIEGILPGHPVLWELRQLFSLLEGYGLSNWVQLDTSIVRGLSYYTGIVFEAFDRSGQFRAICGGGRYDSLSQTLGGRAIPACGFGLGDCVIMEVLREYNLLPSLGPDLEVMVVPANESLRQDAIKVLSQLRQEGIVSDVIMESKKLRQSLSYADRKGARRVVILAPREWSQGLIILKNFASQDDLCPAKDHQMTVEELLFLLRD